MASSIPAGFPDATNTGVPTGTKLTAYSGPMTITQAGTVIDGKIIHGTLTISADNVIVKNCQISDTGFWGVAANGNNVTIQNCTITGTGGNSAITGAGTFLGNNISGFENGIHFETGGGTIKGNYIHDLQSSSGDGHFDGIEVRGGTNGLLIEGNTVIGRDTSDIIIQDYQGPVNNVTINHNFLGGDPGYNIYVEGRFGNGTTNVKITDNYISEGHFGYYSIVSSSPVISAISKAMQERCGRRIRLSQAIRLSQPIRLRPIPRHPIRPAIHSMAQAEPTPYPVAVCRAPATTYSTDTPTPTCSAAAPEPI